MTALFDSIFNSNTASVNPLQLLLALAVSLLLGLALVWVYKYRTLYTREFLITLTLLPSLMTLVIFLVNGSLGTSIAVAGTFSLIRFRSATSGSRELLAIFLSMIIGLAAGTGFLLLAIVFTSLILAVWFLLEKKQGSYQAQTRRHLSLTLPQSDQIEKQLQTVFKQYCTAFDLITIKSQQNGKQLTLDYEIDLRSATSDFDLTKKLIASLGHIDIKLTTKAKKRKNL